MNSSSTDECALYFGAGRVHRLRGHPARPPLPHTPLMSLTNALDAIAVVGAMVLVGEHIEPFQSPSDLSRSSPPPGISWAAPSSPTARLEDVQIQPSGDQQ